MVSEMRSILYTELPYQENTPSLFAPFKDCPYAMLLDSCQAKTTSSRFDIIVANPVIHIETRNKTTMMYKAGEMMEYQGEPFSIIKKELTAFTKQYKFESNQFKHLPFRIGAVGYFSYDIGRLLETLPNKAPQDINLPEAIIGIYEWSIINDHHLKQTWLITGFDRTHKKYQFIQHRLFSEERAEPNFEITKPFESNMQKALYADAFSCLKKHIQQGDCYQANLSHRFTANYQGSEWQVYQHLRAKNPTPFAAYLNIHPHGKILSLSPERFLQVQQGNVETKPIKGTAARFPNPEDDRRSAEALKNSSKDQAENLMIVDLLRNDIGKVCEPGSIQVPKLFALESYPNVHHLVSTIIGKLEKGYHSLDLLRHCFPGGSITGTPKIRAMEIIENLERQRRSIYCGSIAYFDINGDMDSNILIRTIICENNKMHCYAGGAIVYDSDMEKEYAETLIKIEKLINIIENCNQIMNA